MAQIKINEIIYGSNNSADIIYKNTTVEEKLNSIPIFDPSDNTYIEANQYDYLTYGHIIDSLKSEDSNKVLSAKQGKVLDEQDKLLNERVRVLEEEPQSVVLKMTQKEYDSLPSSKYSDGILYAIVDDNGEANGTAVAKPIELTKAQYEALGDSVLNDNILYAITDGDGLTAKGIEYDGSVSGLGNNIQDAIDNLSNKNTLSVGQTIRIAKWDWFYAHNTNVWRTFINFPFLMGSGADYDVVVNLVAIDSVPAQVQSYLTSTVKFGAGVMLDFSYTATYGTVRMGQIDISITRTK